MIPRRANIVVVPITALKGGMKEAEMLLKNAPGAKLGRCEVCFCKVLLAPSTLEQKRNNPGHNLVCRDCIERLAPGSLRKTTAENVTVGGEADLAAIQKLKRS